MLGRRVAVVLLAGTVGAGTTTASAASPAGADPIAAKRAEAAALAFKIDAQGREMEVLAEQYDGAKLHADAVTMQLGAAQQQYSVAQDQATRARATLSAQAVEAYIRGGYLSPPQTAPYSGHLDLVVQKDYFGLATNGEHDALDRLRAAERSLAEQGIALQATQKDARSSLDALASRERAVAQADQAEKATLAQVQGELTQLVAQQQAQLAAARIAQEQATIAAQLAQQRAQEQTAAAAAARANQLAAAAAAARANQLAAAAIASRSGSGLLPPVNKPTPQRTAPSPPPPAGPPAPPPSGSRGLIALAFARSQLGKPYQWAGAGPDSYDCSGLTMRAWEAAGVSLPHLAAAQYAQIAHVAIADLQPGDLVFFGSDLHHVGIYAGGGQMIDAPYTGTVVRYDSIFWGDLIGGGRP